MLLALDVGNTNILGQNAQQSQANTTAATNGLAGLFSGSNLSALSGLFSSSSGGAGAETGVTNGIGWSAALDG